MADQLLRLFSGPVPRPVNGKTYIVLVCPRSGDACVGHDHEPVPVECVPVGRVRELETARDTLTEKVKRLEVDKTVVFRIGPAVLFGSRENVEKANWTLNHLKAKAGERASG